MDDRQLRELRDELEAAKGSFLEGFFTGTWSADRFERLLTLMEQACEDHEGAERVERWIASGFWFVESWVRTVALRPQFTQQRSRALLEADCERIVQLTSWFFDGERPAEAAPAEPDEGEALGEPSGELVTLRPSWITSEGRAVED